ncbi:unnamed protein product [Amoebophrya sp. A25]|nr:unnamed protein product [Amoebophrya sp. A25]|eukprot:GSA25T00005866001.1
MVFEKTLVTMVKGIRAARGQEDQYIAEAVHEIKEEIKGGNLRVKSAAVLKLAYLNMLGHDIMWASFAIVDTMSRADKMSLRRPAYLAAAFCFQEKNDLGLMLINHFKKELMTGKKSPTEMGIALSNLAVICTPDMGRELIGDLISLLSSNKAYIRKKVVLCMFRMFLRYPLGLRQAFPKLKERLTDEDQGVLTATVNTFLELTRKNARNYLILVPHFFTLLTETSNNWLMIKLLKVFAQLCPLEPRLAGKLQSPLQDILNTTRAKSVEFETIRCVTRVLSWDCVVVAQALEKARSFLLSGDRNLRYLGLEVVDEFLKRNATVPYTDLPLPSDLHEVVLEAIEEVDQTIRVVALSILDKIVSKESFPRIADKLLRMSNSTSHTGSGDEYVKTLLTMGEQDQYALVEDFGWYVLTLADIAKKKHSVHGQTVADQFADVCARVEGVRPYAVSVAQILIIGTGTGSTGLQSCAPSMISSCAWVLGEYPQFIEENYTKQILDIFLSKEAQALTPSTQVTCMWAAMKVFCKRTCNMEGDMTDQTDFESLRESFLASMREMVLSPHVEVSDRATIAFFLLQWSSGKEALQAFYPSDELEVLAGGEQDAVVEPEDLDVPFYEEPERFPPADSAEQSDHVALDAASPMVNGHPDANGHASAAADMIMSLKKGEAEQAAAVPSAPTPVDPLAAMREKLQQNKQQYSVVRKEKPKAEQGVGSQPVTPLVAASQAAFLQQQQQQAFLLAQQQQAAAYAAQQQAAALAAQQQAAVVAAQQNFLPTISEKELQDFLGKRWTVWGKDDSICVYCCIKNRKGTQLRVDLRVEKTGNAAVKDAGVQISDVKLVAKPGGASASVLPNGEFALVEGEFAEERSGKLKASLNLAPLLERAAASPSATQVDGDALTLGNFDVVYQKVWREKVVSQRSESSSSTSNSSSEAIDLATGQTLKLAARSDGDDLLDLLDASSPAANDFEAALGAGDSSVSSSTTTGGPGSSSGAPGGGTVVVSETEVPKSALVSLIQNRAKLTALASSSASSSASSDDLFSVGLDVPAPAPPQPLTLRLPPTVFLEPKRWSEDEIASYIGQNSKTHLTSQAGDVCQLPFANLRSLIVQNGPPTAEQPEGVVSYAAVEKKIAEELLPKAVGKAAVVCGFHGLQQGAGGSAAGPRKFLLISQPWQHKGAEAAPHLVSLCAGIVKDGVFNLRVTVKGADQASVDAIKDDLAKTLKDTLAAVL